MLTPCLLSLAAIIVAIPTPHISAQPRESHAMPARGPSNISSTLPDEVTEVREVPEVQKAQGTTNHPRAATGQAQRTASQPLPGRQSCHHSPSHSQPCNLSHSPSHTASPHQLNQSCCQHTPFQYSQDSLDTFPPDSVETPSHPEGSLLTEKASNCQVLFYTRLQAPHRERYQADDCEDWPWCSGEYHPPEQVPEAFPQKSQWDQVP